MYQCFTHRPPELPDALQWVMKPVPFPDLGVRWVPESHQESPGGVFQNGSGGVSGFGVAPPPKGRDSDSFAHHTSMLISKRTPLPHSPRGHEASVHPGSVLAQLLPALQDAW